MPRLGIVGHVLSDNVCQLATHYTRGRAEPDQSMQPSHEAEFVGVLIPWDSGCCSHLEAIHDAHDISSAKSLLLNVPVAKLVKFCPRHILGVRSASEQGDHKGKALHSTTITRKRLATQVLLDGCSAHECAWPDVPPAPIRSRRITEGRTVHFSCDGQNFVTL